tara:strand:- start:1358 stop:1603 length:246 start_codon:yes stop_codon:yes gene_type:complete
MEDLLLQHKTLEEIALFLGVSISTVSASLSRNTPKSYKREAGIGAWDELKNSYVKLNNSSDYTVRDLEYIKNNDESYFKTL